MIGLLKRVFRGRRPWNTPAEVIDAAVAELQTWPEIAEIKQHDNDPLAFDIVPVAADSGTITLHLENIVRYVLAEENGANDQPIELQRGLKTTLTAMVRSGSSRPPLIVADILPMVRHIAYYPWLLNEEKSKDADGLCYRLLAGDLICVLLQDIGEGYASLMGSHVREAGQTVEAIWQEAERNLKLVLTKPKVIKRKGGFFELVLETDELLTLCLLLDLTLLDAVLDDLGLEEVVLSAPLRNTILLAQAEGAIAMGEMTKRLLKNDHPQSECLFTYQRGAGEIAVLAQLTEGGR